MDARAHPDAPAKGRVFDCLPPSYRASLDAEASAHLAVRSPGSMLPRLRGP